MALTTLILGAGLGKEYGFPDGLELRRLIINELPDHESDLKRIVEYSTAETVDEIAAQHKIHADKIRRIVVKVLRNRENEHSLLQNDQPNTYKIMLKQIIAAQEKGDDVRIITFNYDRSLQHLIHCSNSIESDTRKINPEIVTAIYGRLAPMYFEDTQENRNRQLWYHDYGSPTGPRLTAFNQERQGYNTEYHQEQILDQTYRASNIQFIGEAQPEHLNKITETLNESNRVFFLGLGYHEANMRSLGFKFEQSCSNKIIAGTGLGLSKNYIDFLIKKYPAIDLVEPCDAYTFLKTKFDISDPSHHLKKLN